jgi:hypothetical protein
MNVTQSLSSLYSQLSSSSSSSQGSINQHAFQVNSYNPLPLENHFEQEKTLDHQLSLEQKMLIQLNMRNFQYPNQIGQQSTNTAYNNHLNDLSASSEATGQLVRRPITGCNNFSTKNKYKQPSLSSSSQVNLAKQALFPFKHVIPMITELPTTDAFSSPFLPSFLSPILKYSRKVFVGGLPPDIDESKNELFLFYEIIVNN